MIRLFVIVSFLAALVHGTAESDARASAGAEPQPTRVVLGDDEVKKDRAALQRTSKILPFASDPFLKPYVSLGGPFGVSLGLGLPAPLPLEEHHRPSIHTGGRPLAGPGRRPECAHGDNYCLFNELYPLDKVNSIIDRYYNDVRHLYSDLYRFPESDIIYYDNRTLNYRHGGHFVCESSVQYLRPGWAQNIHGEWVAVVNTDKFPQSFRAETCRYQNRRCEYLPPCYKSRCVQRYNYVKLLCLDPYRPTYKPTVDVFQIPSACSCFVEDFTYY